MLADYLSGGCLDQESLVDARQTIHTVARLNPLTTITNKYEIRPTKKNKKHHHTMKLFKKKSHKSGYCNISEPISDLDPKRISAIKSKHVSELDPKVISALKAQHLESFAAAAAASKAQNPSVSSLDKDGTDVTISLTPSPSQSSKSTPPSSKVMITVRDESPSDGYGGVYTSGVQQSQLQLQDHSKMHSGGKKGSKKSSSPMMSTKRLFGNSAVAAASSTSSSPASVAATATNSPFTTATTPTPVTATATHPGPTTPVGVNASSNPVMASPGVASKPPIAPKTPDTFFQGKNRKRIQRFDDHHYEIDTQMPVHYFQNLDGSGGYDDFRNVTDEDESSPVVDSSNMGHGHNSDNNKNQGSSPNDNGNASKPSHDHHGHSVPTMKNQEPKQQLPVHSASPPNATSTPFSPLERNDSTCSDIDKSFSPDIISVHSDITEPSFHSHRKSQRAWHRRIREGFQETCRQHNLKSPISFLEMILDSICSGHR